MHPRDTVADERTNHVTWNKLDADTLKKHLTPARNTGGRWVLARPSGGSGLVGVDGGGVRCILDRCSARLGRTVPTGKICRILGVFLL